MNYMSSQVDRVVDETVPAVSSQVTELVTALSMQLIQLENHNRKWNLIIQGVKGSAGEPETTTRQKCIDLAKSHLQVADADGALFAACHRLKQQDNAGIILRFCDLQQRNRWLMGARHLSHHPDNISITPDVAPAIRPIRKDIMMQRKTLAPEIKAMSSVRYLAQWPFIQLAIRNQQPTLPRVTKDEVASLLLGRNARLAVQAPK